MSSEKTSALVIRLADFSETSRVVTFFTREFGKLPLLAKGAKRLKGQFQSALDLLSECDIVFLRKSSGGLGILTEASLCSRFPSRGNEIHRLYGGFYLVELLDGLTEEYDPHPGLYDRALDSLGRLADPESLPRLTIIRFELALLREIGHLPNFEECLVCGKPTDGRAPYAFWVSQGGLLCRNCQKKEYRNNRLTLESVQLLKQLASEDESELPELGERNLRELGNVTTTAIIHNLGRQPRTLRYLKPIR